MGDLLLLAVGILAVVGGAELFFDGLISFSSKLKTAPFVLTALVSGFELENLAVGIAANAKGLPGSAAGTFLGGTTFLALGVLGAGALIQPLDANLPWKPVAAAGASPLALLIVARDGELSRLDGAALVAWFAVVMLVLAYTGRDVLVEAEPEAPALHPLIRLLTGLAILSVGGDVLSQGIRNTVARFGISQTLLGNTAVAASVEAEELGRVVIPTKRGRSDVAIGNIVGTVTHFIALNAGVIALVKPLRLDHTTMNLHLPVAVLSPPLVALLLIFRPRITRGEGGLLVGAYVAYVIVAIVRASGG